MRLAVGVRAAPLAVLFAIVVAAAGVRLRVRRAKTTARPSPAAPSSSSGAPTLAAPPGTASARVEEHPTRMLHEDPRHTHRARGHGPDRAELAWSVDVGGPVEAQVTVAPDGQTLYVASLGGSLIALALDGTQKWSAALGDRAYATPCVAEDGTIYAGSDAHKLFAIAPEGRVKWTLSTDADVDTGPVLLKDGSVAFASGTAVMAVRPGGDLAWRVPAKGKVFASPAVSDDGLVVVGAQDHHVYAIAPAGRVAWSTDLGADVDGTPAIADDGAVFVGTDAGDVVRLDAAGAVVWRTSVGGYVRGALSIARNGDVLAGVYGPTPRVVRVTAADGAVRGFLAVPGTGARDFGVHGGPLEDDEGWLYFGAQDDYVYAVDPAGAVRWRYLTGGDVDAPATLLPDGMLVIGSDDGRVYAFAARL